MLSINFITQVHSFSTFVKKQNRQSILFINHIGVFVTRYFPKKKLNHENENNLDLMNKKTDKIQIRECIKKRMESI